MNDIIHWKLYAEWLDKGNFCADFLQAMMSYGTGYLILNLN